jgi:lipoprotein-anchoring transpeptidase ErfK/SrfK
VLICGQKYKVLEKVKDKHSNKYNAPMPFSLKFSSDWKAIHGTGFASFRSWAQYLGAASVGSHGCVGLPDGHAKTLFNWATVGTSLSIRDD